MLLVLRARGRPDGTRWVSLSITKAVRLLSSIAAWLTKGVRACFDAGRWIRTLLLAKLLLMHVRRPRLCVKALWRDARGIWGAVHAWRQRK